MWENTDQKISKYGHFSRSVLVAVGFKNHIQKTQTILFKELV